MINPYTVVDRYRAVEALLVGVEDAVGPLVEADRGVFLRLPSSPGWAYRLLWSGNGLWVVRVRVVRVGSGDADNPPLSTVVDVTRRRLWRCADLNDLVGAAPGLTAFELCAADLLRRHLAHQL